MWNLRQKREHLEAVASDTPDSEVGEGITKDVPETRTARREPQSGSYQQDGFLPTPPPYGQHWRGEHLKRMRGVGWHGTYIAEATNRRRTTPSPARRPMPRLPPPLLSKTTEDGKMSMQQSPEDAKSTGSSQRREKQASQKYRGTIAFSRWLTIRRANVPKRTCPPIKGLGSNQRILQASR